MNKKYVIVIDLPDDVQYILINGVSENHCYTRVERVDDLEELNSDYINKHFGELQDGAYQAGLNDAWEAARGIVVDTDHGGLALGTLSGIFGTQSYSYIMRENTAQEAIDKIKAYDGKHSDRIEVGDEVINNTTGTKGILLEPETEDLLATVVVPNHRWNTFSMSHTNLTKTGRHFDIEGILEEMKNG